MKKIMNLRLFDASETETNAPGAGTGDGGQKGNAAYTYEQLEEIADARVKKAERNALADFFRKQGMSESQITEAINDFKEKQKANKPNVTAIERERDEAREELQRLKQEKTLTAKGVKAEDLDYVMFKVGKMVDEKTDFTKAMEKFLKDNPRYVGGTGYRVSTSSGTNEQVAGGNVNSSINNAIRNAIRR